MSYVDAFLTNRALIDKLGMSNAHMIWALSLYLEESDFEGLASAGLTDGRGDKKIDFIHLDLDSSRIVFAQGYYSSSGHDSAPANKASDLNTAAAWLLSGDLSQIPDPLKPVIRDCRAAIDDGDIDLIELLYVHNLPESVNVTRELQTAATHMRRALGADTPITVLSRELGSSTIEHLFSTQESHIEITEDVICPAKIAFKDTGPDWEAGILSIPGDWLNSLYTTYGQALFSANYRGFLGITKRRKINTAIRASAESKQDDFWVYNNGITLLTLGIKVVKDGAKLMGISVINGAQTTGSIGSVDRKKRDLANVRVLCRIIQCSDTDKIGDIVKYNNTQNEMTTWDQYSNHPEQHRIEGEFRDLGHSYSRTRGFRPGAHQINIEEVVQPLLAFQGRFRDANRGKNLSFERKPLYKTAFEGKKARHILFVYTLSRAIDERRLELKKKSSEDTIIVMEEQQLALLRHLKFKNFFIAVVAKTLEAILRQKVDLATVAFSPQAAQRENNSIVDLIAAWSKVVETLLTFVSTQMTAADVTERLTEENIVDTIVTPVGALAYAIQERTAFDTFCRMASPS